MCVLCKSRARSETKLIVRSAKSACRITYNCEVSVRSGTSSSRKVTLSRNYCIFEFCPKSPAQANICRNTVNCTSKWRRRCFRGRQSPGAGVVWRNNWEWTKSVRKTCDFTDSGVTSDTPPRPSAPFEIFQKFFLQINIWLCIPPRFCPQVDTIIFEAFSFFFFPHTKTIVTPRAQSWVRCSKNDRNRPFWEFLFGV